MCLLQGFERPVEDRKGAAPARERLRGQATELNWLMRTTYIAHDHAPGKSRQKDAAGLSNGQVEGLGSREELLEDIEVSFNVRLLMVKSLLVHSWSICEATASGSSWCLTKG